MTLVWRSAAATHVGRVRARNEDAYRVDPARGLFLVADGMGGHAAGEVASALAVAAAGDALAAAVDAGLRGEALSEAVRAGFRYGAAAIEAHAAAHPAARGLGTTLVAAVLLGDGTLRIGHLGDSRGYLLRGERLVRITRDHTWVQDEVDAGRLTRAAARRHPHAHVLTRALAAGSADLPDVLAGRLRPGDLLLLATDGLTGHLSDRAIRSILRAPRTLAERAARLVRTANRRGGKDNVTVVAVECVEAPE